MDDCRMQLIEDIELILSQHVGDTDISPISNAIIKILGDYNITKQETGIVAYDDHNERILKRYAGCLVIDGKSKTTISQYIRELKRMTDFLGNKHYEEIGTYDIRYYLACKKENGVSNVSLENARSYMSAFFQWLTNEDIIAKNPMLRINPIKCEKEIKKPFSDVEIDSLRCACKNKKQRAIIETLLTSGVRVAELSNLNKKDVNFDDLSVFVRNGKGAKDRITYITQVSAKYIKDYLDSRSDDCEALIINQSKERIDSGGIRFILREIGKTSGISNVHPHRFRRTFATNLAKRGMEVQEIQKLLGHSNIATTMTYVYTDDTKVNASYRKFIA